MGKSKQMMTESNQEEAPSKIEQFTTDRKYTLIRAKFRGGNSLGFKRGLNYNLKFIQIESRYIFIETTTEPKLMCEYSNIYTFFDNWSDIKPR